MNIKEDEKRRKSQEDIDHLFMKVQIQPEDIEQEIGDSDDVEDLSEDRCHSNISLGSATGME